jgi:hypothetical protein
MADGCKLKFMFCFMQTTREPYHLDTINFGTVKYHGHTYKIIMFTIIFRDKAFRYGDVAKLCGLSWNKRWSTLRTIL